MSFWTSIKNAVANKWPREYSHDILPPQEMRQAMTLPWVRATMVKFSRDESKRNPYYASVLNKLAEQVLGPCPTIIAIGETAQDNDLIEDSYVDWTQQNLIGRALRLLRREAALTGIGFLLPVKVETFHPIQVGFKAYGWDSLAQPPNKGIQDRCIDGIQYNKDWEPEYFYFENDTDKPDRRSAKDVIWWSRGYEKGILEPVPECLAAFTFYPFVRRYLQAVIEGEEFRTSFPMALELDPTVYKANEMKLQKLEKFQYQPRSVPSLPVGTTLRGMPSGSNPGQIDKTLRAFAGACALTIDMPANLALGDSSNSNMATAQIDSQPWKNRVNVDRFDLNPALRKTFNYWYMGARNVRGLTPESSRPGNLYEDYYPHIHVYDPLFNHPDPQKNANARATDLASGVGTLNEIYSQLGMNPRRQLEREAKLMEMTYQEYVKMIMLNRSNLALNVLGTNNEETQTEA